MNPLLETASDLKYRASYGTSKLLFGNAVRFPYNVHGLASEWLARRRSSVERDGMDERAETLRGEGYVELGQPHDPTLVESLADTFQRLIENDEYAKPRYPMDLDTEEAYSWTLRDPVSDFPELLDLITDDIVDILRNYYGSNVELYTDRTTAGRNAHVPRAVVEASETFSNYWHCDSHRTDKIKLFVPLGDVTEDDGPLHVITKSQTKRLVRNDHYSHRERDSHIPGSAIEDQAEVRTFTGPAGSTALANTQTTIHRAGIPAEGRHRDLVQFQFGPSGRPLEAQLADLRRRAGTGA